MAAGQPLIPRNCKENSRRDFLESSTAAVVGTAMFGSLAVSLFPPISEHELSDEQMVKDETDQTAKKRFCKLLEKHGMQRLIPAADQYLKPSVRISLAACGLAGRDGIYSDVDEVVDESEVGESKFGGFPDLPADFEWPLWDEVPLTFLAQFRLSVLARFDRELNLPRAGMLYFFYDETLTSLIQDEKVVPLETKVHFHPGDVSTLRRTPAPEDAEWVQPPAHATFYRVVTIPFLNTVEHELMHLTEEEDLQYEKVVLEWRNFNPEKREPRHFLGGFVDVNANDPRLQLVTIKGQKIPWNDWHKEKDEARKQALMDSWCLAAQDWRLLLQVDSDDDFGLHIGDYDKLDFFIHDDALANQSFDTVVCELGGG
jgi:hypothetical protein